MRIPVTMVAALAAHGAASRAHAAQLQDVTKIHSAHVHLSDLFSGLDIGQDRDIGPAPAPGASFTVGASQLHAIADQFGVNWSDSSALSRLVLTRDTREIARDDVMPIVISALHDKGVPEDADITASAFASPVVPAEEMTAPQLETMVYDRMHGRFSAFFAIPADGADYPRITFRMDGAVDRAASIVTARHAIPAGAVLARDDVQIAQVSTLKAGPDVLTDPGMVVGQVARQAIAENAPLSRPMLQHVDVVQKAAPVVLVISSAGMVMTASGIALEAGGMGEQVHVLNPVSKMVVKGLVIDHARVAVEPGTMPMPPLQRPPEEVSSLWRSGSRAFFKDQRAAQVGDLITVIVGITDAATMVDNTTAAGSGNEAMSLPSIFGLKSKIATHLASGLNTSSSNGNTATGSITRNETVTVRVGGTITQVLPNGNFVVVARQEVRVNSELRELQLSGVVRPQYITADNTVTHDRMSEARISYGGRGQLTTLQTPRYGQQFIDAIAPF